MQHFYLPAENFRDDYIIASDKKLIHQLSKVLRSQEGDRFAIFDNSGEEYLAQLIELNKLTAKFLIIDRKLGQTEAKVAITIYQSLIKPEKFEWFLQKAVEVGVKKIVPIVAKRSIIKDITPAKKQRYREIIKEATEQSERVKLLELGEVVNFTGAVKSASLETGLKLIAAERYGHVVPELFKSESFQIFVGPEGGWDKEELNYAQENSLEPVGLGKRIFRSETCGIYLASVLDFFSQ